FRGGDDHVHRVAIGLNVEGTAGRELHQVKRSQVAGGVVEEHVLRAGIGGVDAGGVLRRVPAVDGGVELHARIAAVPGGVGDLLHELGGGISFDRLAAAHGLGGELAIRLNGDHELVG